jgi:hypothetical protein
MHIVDLIPILHFQSHAKAKRPPFLSSSLPIKRQPLLLLLLLLVLSVLLSYS